MNKYEMVVVIAPDLDEDGRVTILARLQEAIMQAGHVEEIEEWGEKDLAYEINYIKTGYYYVMHFEAEPSIIEEVERRARILDKVIRYLTVRKDA